MEEQSYKGRTRCNPQGVAGGETEQGNMKEENAGIVKSSKARTWPKGSLKGTETLGITEQLGEGDWEVVVNEKAFDGSSSK